MYELVDVGAADLQELRCFPGLIGLFIYSPSSKIFERTIREAYHELHMQSGCSLLLLAGKTNWVSKTDRSRMRGDILGAMGDDFHIEEHSYMTPMMLGNRFKAAETLLNLKARFGLRVTELPCLILLSKIDGTDGYVFPIDRLAINVTTDALTDELSEVFEICRIETENKPCTVNPREAEIDNSHYDRLVHWRQETIEALAPTINRRRLFRATRRLAPGIAGAAIDGLAGLVT